MLAKILEEMWVEPQVLEALSEEQKRILFLKMREEQVRRWREREEREAQDIGVSRPRKASSKRVSWMLGRDGDVSVIVIGEVDEFRSSKLLQNLINNRLHHENMNGIQTADAQAGREAQPLGFKAEIHPPCTDGTATGSGSPNSQSSEDEMDSCSADDDLKDPDEGSDSESGSRSDNLADWAPLYRPRLSNHGNKAALKAQLSDAGGVSSQARDILIEEKKTDYGGRVAQLRRTFASDRHGLNKPPLPVKPAHLLTRDTPLIH
uniref:SH2 domain-containing protein 4A n=1 Tax=Doryrhamphus excisus TaxID=161450 RepID=UPI0025AE3020|nr:SH2 domain-containing protein 4A [Doryrhamphus excisus]XP_057918859.1 SH2 domain-containing protein 4A [Doryrhamphus excisus]